MIKLKELIKEECNCGSSCCGVNESIADKNKAKKIFQSIMKKEGEFRNRMFKSEQAFLADARPENRDAAKQLKTAYKNNVTSFMREAAKLVNKLK